MRRQDTRLEQAGPEFQSTHPIRDATEMLDHSDKIFKISIHASHTGCDFRQHKLRRPASDFNPRIPYGMRQGCLLTSSETRLFQSTHPIRDATRACLDACGFDSVISIHASHTGCDVVWIELYVQFDVISIHASHTGCDMAWWPCFFVSANFNPRIPYGMRHQGQCTGRLRHCNFNPRIPYGMRHATFYCFCSHQVLISIHASHTGCDLA